MRGRSTLTTVPCPTSLVTDTWPPLWRTIPNAPHCEAEAGALAALFRGEERLEDALERRRVHPIARVAHGDSNVAAGGYLAELRLVRVDARIGRLDRERAAVRHRVARVRGEVQEDLLELARVDENGAEARFIARAELDRRADEPLNHLLGGHRRSCLMSTARGSSTWRRLEREELARELGRANGAAARTCSRSGFHVVDLHDHRAALEVREDHVDVAEDDRKEVIEVVRDAAGEAPEGVHPLRVAELRGGLVKRLFWLGAAGRARARAPREGDRGRERSRGCSVTSRRLNDDAADVRVREPVHASSFVRAVNAIGAAKAHRRLPHDPGLVERTGEALAEPREIFGRHEREEISTEPIGDVVAELLRERGRAIGHARLVIEQEHDVRAVLDDGAEELVLLTKRGLASTSLGHVAQHDEPPPGQERRAARRFDGSHVAVGPHDVVSGPARPRSSTRPFRTRRSAREVRRRARFARGREARWPPGSRRR